MQCTAKHAKAGKLALLVILGIMLCACDDVTPSNSQLALTPTLPIGATTPLQTQSTDVPDNSPTLWMYQPVIDQSFGRLDQLIKSYETGTIELIHPRHVYITPTSGETNAKLPTEIIDAIASYTDDAGLIRVMTEEVGALIISIGFPKHLDDPQLLKYHGKDGPVIFVQTVVKGYKCATWQSVGYLLTKTGTGWKADAVTGTQC